MQKKSNGEGTVYYSDSRKRWIGQVTVGKTESGAPKRKSIYGKTKKEVCQKMFELQAELYTGQYVAPNRITVATLTKSLIEDDKDFNIISESTYNRKISTYKRINNSNLACIAIQDVKEADVKAFLKTITNYSDSVIRKDFELLKRCFKEAIHRSIINKNPMFGIKCPKSTKAPEKVRALTIDEQKRFLEVLNTHDIRYATQMKLMLLTGMRMGEINALDIDDVSFAFKTINIRRTLTRDGEDKMVVGKTTKTYAGIRKIPLPDRIAALIQDYKSTPNAEHLLFWDEKANKVVSTSQVNNQFARTLEKYNVLDEAERGKVSLHSLRHTYATRCIEAGMPPKVLQTLLGHTDIKITLNTYCDAFSEFKDESIAKLEQYLVDKNLAI